MKKALITGITGQGGSYLAEFLFQPARTHRTPMDRHNSPCIRNPS